MTGGEVEERSGDINGAASSDDDDVYTRGAKKNSTGKYKKKHKSKSKKRKKRHHKSRSSSPALSSRSRSRSSSRSKSHSRSASPKSHRLKKEEDEKSNSFRLEKSSGDENSDDSRSLKQKLKQENLESTLGKERKKERNSSRELSDTSVQKEEKKEASLKKTNSPHKKPRSQSRSRNRQSRSTSHTKHKRSRSRSYSRHRKSRSRSRKRSISRSRGHGHLSSPRRNSYSYSRDRRYSRSPKRSRTRRRSRSRSKQRSNSRTRRRSRSHSRRTRQSYSRSRYRKSRSHSRHRSQSWSRSRRQSGSPLYSRRRDRSRSRSQEQKRNRSRSRSKSKSPDKKETKDVSVPVPVVAATNIATLVKPLGSENPPVGRVTGGKKSIAELTAFCKKLTEEKVQDNGGVADNDNKEEEEDSLQPAHHPFLVKPVADIYIPPILFPPIKPVKLEDPSKPLPEQFPVSCGSQHREKEAVDGNGTMVENMDGVAPSQDAGVFSKAPVEKIDISTLVVKRMDAQRRLTVNSEDLEARLTLQEIEMKLQNWCQSNVKPGQFTGQLVKSLLPSRELQGGQHAWARKDMFQNLSPLSGGVGMMLMQKMGWQPGQVLGKRGDGYAEPIAVQVKVDRKGLSSTLEKPTTKKTSVLDVQGKHPVSALSEYCSKRKWPLPDFKLAFDHGAPHSRQFLFKVVVNDMEYQPAVVSGNKKQAKADAAVYALKALGLMPENAQPQY